MDTVRNLGIEEEVLRDQLERAESRETNVDDNEFDSCKPEPITSKMVSKTASYYTFIPAREILDSEDSILNVAEKLNGVVRASFLMVTVVTTSCTRLSASRRPFRLSRTPYSACGWDSKIHASPLLLFFSGDHLDQGKHY